ncbi:MAG TPA: hypothetical protein VIA63_00455 [Candidatus Limnocylindria bacterium]|jgi:hypothetical protein
MFRALSGRIARALAAGALILSLTATTFAGSANAADDKTDCRTAAHDRNDAVHLLHTAWKEFSGDLKDLAHEARDLQHDSDKTSKDLKKDARAEVASAKMDLKDVWVKAHADIQAAAELGAACTGEDEDNDEDSTETTTTVTTATEPADPNVHTFDTSGLDAKYAPIVDQAIADMQAIVDDARKAIGEMATAAETTDTADDTKAKKDVAEAKADREKAKADREEAKKSEKEKSHPGSANGKSNGTGNGKGKDRD